MTGLIETSKQTLAVKHNSRHGVIQLYCIVCNEVSASNTVSQQADSHPVCCNAQHLNVDCWSMWTAVLWY